MTRTGSFEELGTLPRLYEKITVTTDATYHVQLSGTFYDYDDASRTAAQYSGGFAAYEDGAFYARAGSYTSLSARGPQQPNMAALPSAAAARA